MNVTDPRAPTRNKSPTTSRYDIDTLHVIENHGNTRGKRCRKKERGPGAS